MLSFSFIAFTVHASIFCLCFSQKQSANQPKKYKGKCFTTSSKSTCKNSGSFEGKQILPEKVTCVPLAPSHSIVPRKGIRAFIVIISLSAYWKIKIVAFHPELFVVVGNMYNFPNFFGKQK